MCLNVFDCGRSSSYFGVVDLPNDTPKVHTLLLLCSCREELMPPKHVIRARVFWLMWVDEKGILARNGCGKSSIYLRVQHGNINTMGYASQTYIAAENSEYRRVR